MSQAEEKRGHARLRTDRTILDNSIAFHSSQFQHGFTFGNYFCYSECDNIFRYIVLNQLFLCSLQICIVCAAVFGVVLYRMSQLTSDSLIGGSPHKAILMPCSAAVINLFLITFLNYVYDKLAVYLTEMEYRRTQSEFDDSLTLKIYLFQFINYYSSIFYIAFLKGKFVGYPAKYNRILGYRQEEVITFFYHQIKFTI